MILSDTDQYIKDSLETIISGLWDEKFAPDQIERLLQLSFILNHLDAGVGFFQFEYNGTKIKLTGLDDMISTEHAFEGIISAIKSDKSFEGCLKQFLRDKKISSII